jgi:hypothetical protein
MTELERERELLAVNSAESGRFEDEFERFSWQYMITLDQSASDLVSMAGANITFEPMKVEVTVTWKEGKKENSFVLQEMIFPIVSKTTTVSPIPPPRPPAGIAPPPGMPPPSGMPPPPMVPR